MISTPSSDATPEPGQPQQHGKRPDPAVVAAVIGALGLVVAAIIATYHLSPWHSPTHAAATSAAPRSSTPDSSSPQVSSEGLGPATPSPAPPSSASRSETAGGAAATWTDYNDAGGTAGPLIPAGTTVAAACKVAGFKVPDGDTWWYRIASSPWDGRFYASADAFYNNGLHSGTLIKSPLVDPAVLTC